MITLKNIINGQADDAPASLPFFDPATGLQIGTAPDSDAAAVDAAFQAAAAAFKTYKRTTPGQRQAMLLKLADLIEANADRLLDAEVACTGKPRAVTRELGIVLIFDEILSGFRTGPGCAQEYLG